MKNRNILFICFGLILLGGLFYFIYSMPKIEINDQQNSYTLEVEITSKISQNVKLNFKEIYLLGDSGYETDNNSYVIVNIKAGETVKLKFYKEDITKKYSKEDKIVIIKRRWKNGKTKKVNY